MSTLFVVSTPIGNLEDITFRALRILKEVDLIVCEDTRQTLKLLNHYNIKKPLVSYFQHSKLSKVDYIIGRLYQGKNLALVTDAGTPGISDPGGILVQKFTSGQAGKIKIVPIPGPNAAIAALSVSGFAAESCFFVVFAAYKRARYDFFRGC